MTAYTNDKGTRWEVACVPISRLNGDPEWRIRRVYSVSRWFWLLRDWWPTESAAQAALDEMARKNRWMKAEE